MVIDRGPQTGAVTEQVANWNRLLAGRANSGQ
jgi:hypothetical protein